MGGTKRRWYENPGKPAGALNTGKYCSPVSHDENSICQIPYILLVRYIDLLLYHYEPWNKQLRVVDAKPQRKLRKAVRGPLLQAA